ncbi:MAG: Topoisomerase 1-associated factor 1 [Alyxoria varia]|nr:MAG: Topoisomerase 1-associated factor 1 [Alyxoria varia]
MASLQASASAIDPEVKAFVFSLVSALGGSSAADDGRYVLGDDALPVLKDIKRWLRLYDDKTNRLDVARLLAEANLVKGDLLEILASWPKESPEGSFRSKISLLCVDLLTQVTWPVDKEEQFTAINHFVHKPYLHNAQASYKQAILQHERAQILRTVLRVALPPMAQPRKERSPVEENIIKVVLYFFRNVVMITQPDNEHLDDGDTEISRAATIDSFHYQDIFDLILTLGSSIGDEFVEHDVEIMDILFHLLKGVDVERVFMERDQLVSSNTKELQGLIGKEKGMLAGYARYAPSRHNRFGTKSWLKREDGKLTTVFGQTAAMNEQVALHEMDKSKKWNRPRHGGKKKIPEETLTEFNFTTPLTASARRHLRTFVEKFLDSSFNPLFLTIRKSIEREATRVLDYHRRQYFFLISWFLSAQRVRRKAQAQQKHANGSSASVEEGESFALVASVLNQETFVLLNRTMQDSFDGKSWRDVNACMKCFTQILLTVHEMSESSTEEDQEISENSLNRIFYEQSTHDRIIATLRTFKDQGFGYLNACTELSHVFLRLLERYSKQNVDMHVRTIRRARKKRKEKNGVDEGGHANEDQENEAGDVAEAHKTSTERKFDFDRCAARFINQNTIDTFVTFTKHYRDLSTEQLKRAHRFFYRAAFKMNVSVYLFRVDILSLFNRMIKGPEGMDLDNSMFKEWEELTRQVFRRLTKKIQDRPSLAVELLFSKIPATVYYLEHGHERELPKRTTKAPAELEIKPGMDKAEQIGVAVSMLINQGKADALGWMKRVLKSASDERKSWEAEETARRELEQQDARSAHPEENSESNQDPENPRESEERSAQDTPQTEDAGDSNHQQSKKAPSILVTADNSERRTAMAQDKHLRLLLTVLEFQRLGDPSDEDSTADEVIWIIPSFHSCADLKNFHEIISRHEFAPPVYEEGKSAESFVRRKAKSGGAGNASGRSGHATRTGSGTSDSEGLSEIDEELFAANERGGGSGGEEGASAARGQKKKKGPRRSRRAADELLDDKGLEERRKARKEMERERLRKIKSSLHVSLSDDESDDERDREFFEREEGLRRAVDDAGGLTDVVGGTTNKNGEKIPSKKGSSAEPITLDEDEEDILEAEPSAPLPPARTRKRDSSVLHADSSPSDTDSPASSSRNHNKRPRKPPRANRRAPSTSTSTFTPSPIPSRAASPALLPTSSAVGATYTRGPNAEISPPDSEAETDTENVDGETPPTSQSLSLSQGGNGQSRRSAGKVRGADVVMRDADADAGDAVEGSDEDESDKENVDVGVLSAGVGDGVALERSRGGADGSANAPRVRGGRRVVLDDEDEDE